MARSNNATLRLSQIAELAGVRPSAVSNWRKRFADFPQPVETAAGGHDLYALAAVEAWLREHKRYNPERTNERLLFEAADLLRTRATSDEGIQILAAAIALAEARDRVGVKGAPGSIGERVRLVEEPDPTLAGVFEPLLRLDEATGSRIIGIAESIDSDDRASIFEWVLTRRTRFVETRTNDDLVSLLVRLAGSSRTVLDPAAGEGGLLAAAASGTRQPRMFGQEINESAWRIAKQRFLLHKLDVDMHLGDGLLEDALPDLRVEVVLCDPPYGQENPLSADSAAASRWSIPVLKARTADFVWLEHAINHLTDDGRAYVLLPAGTLFRRGREGELRAELIRRGAVEAIVSLPPGSAQHTGIPLALWIVRRPGVTAEQPVLLLDGAGGDDPSRRSLNSELMKRIVEIAHDWHRTGQVEEENRDLATTVPALQLLGSDANLVPSRWVHGDATVSPEERMEDMDRAIGRFRRARAKLVGGSTELSTIELAEPTNWVPVRELVAGDVAEVNRGVRVRPDDCLQQGVRVLRPRDIGDKILEDEPCYAVPEEMKPRPTLTKAGDIIVSPASGRLRALVVEEGEYILASPLQGLRFRSEWLDPYVAAAFLQSPRNRRFATGVTWGYARVDVRDLELPLLPLAEAQRLRETLEQLSMAEQHAHELAESASDVREKLLNLGAYGDSEGRE